MKKILIASLLAFSFNTIFSQNLVLNPSFETVNAGSLQCGLYSSTQFNAASVNWTSPTAGSPDLHHTSQATSCRSCPFCVGTSCIGNQAPRTGNAMAGIITHLSSSSFCTPNFREYVQGQLSSPLVPGTQYCVEFYVSSADNAPYATNNIGIQFYTTAMNSSTQCPLGTTPHYNYPTAITNTSGWTQISFTFTPTSAYQYFIIGNFYDNNNTTIVNNGGSNSTYAYYYIDDVSVQVCSSNPTITVNSPTICNGQSATLTASSSVSGTTYAWSTGGTGSFISVNPTSTTTYTVTGTSPTSGTGTATATVTVNPQPTVTASASPTSVCAGASTSLTAGGASTYSWSNGSTGTPITVSPTTTTTYTVTGTSTAGCTNTAAVSVTVNPSPTISISASPTSVCPGNSSVLTASGANNYVWSNGSNTNPETVNPTISTSYSVTGTSVSGCTASASVNITVLAGPIVSATDAAICPGENASISASGATNYTWDNGMSGSPIIVSPATTTSYTVSGTDGSGCTGIAVATVTVFSSPTLSITSTPDYCASGNGTATADVINGSMPYDYLWSTSEITAAIASLPAGLYSVTVSDANGCTGSGVVTVSSQAGFTLGANSTQEHCDLLDGTAEIVPINATLPLTYSWSQNPGLNSPTAAGLAAGNYSVTVTDGQCTRTIDVLVGSINGPDAGYIINPSNIGVGEGNAMFIDQSSGALLWFYDFDDGNSSTESNPEHQYQSSGEYETMQIIWDAYGCSDTAYQTITVNEGFAVFIPSAFSPNGDGRNDYFSVSGFGIDPDFFEMSIYDRWGHLVFRSSDINKQWDGQYYLSEDIEDVYQGVFSYHISVKSLTGVSKEFYGRVVKLP